MPAKYCREQAIHNATLLFWEKGYHATSMRDIQTALDMRPGSIYAEFGNKLGLFSSVVEDYVNTSVERLELIAKTDSPLQALQAFVIQLLTDEQAPIFQRQCLLIRSINDLTTLDEQAKKCIIGGLSQLESAFAKVFVSAVAHDELPHNLKIADAARWFQQQIVGLRSSALLSDDSEHMQEAVQHCFNYLPSITRHSH